MLGKLVRGSAAVVVAGTLGFAVMMDGTSTTLVAAQGATMGPTCPAGSGQMQFAASARADGSIATISGTTFTVTQQDGSTRTVTTDGNTRFDALVSSSVSAIVTGDMVMVRGTSGDTSVAATEITDNGQQTQALTNGPGMGTIPNGPMGGSMGQPSASFTGTPPAGVSAGMPGGCAPQGMPPSGQPQGMPGGQPQGQGVPGNPQDGSFTIGSVQQVSGTTLTLSTRDGKTLTVTTDANTKVTGHQTGSFTDLKVGDRVVASAAPTSGADSNATAFTAATVSDRGAS